MRVLWRMQGPERVVAAAMYPHARGHELRVYFEPAGDEDVLQREVASRGEAVLVERADAIREMLRRQGWWPLVTSEHR